MSVPPELLERIAKLEGKHTELGRDVGKIRDRLRGDDPPASGQSSSPAQPSIDTVLRFAELRASLPEPARKILDARRADGASFDALVSFAELAASMAALAPSTAPGSTPGQTAPAAGSMPPVVAPPGVASTAAPRTSQSYPRTMAEYVEIARRDPERKRALDADQVFMRDILAGLPVR